MIVQRMNKWIAAGVLAVAAIPAAGFARTHHPVQAAPALMATSSTTAPTVLASTDGVKHKKVKSKALHSKAKSHTKLSTSKKAHKHLHTKKTKAAKLHAKKSAHKNLSAKAKKATPAT